MDVPVSPLAREAEEVLRNAGLADAAALARAVLAQALLRQGRLAEAEAAVAEADDSGLFRWTTVRTRASLKAARGDTTDYCTACFSKRYPTTLTDRDGGKTA